MPPVHVLTKSLTRAQYSRKESLYEFGPGPSTWDVGVSQGRFGTHLLTVRRGPATRGGLASV